MRANKIYFSKFYIYIYICILSLTASAFARVFDQVPDAQFHVYTVQTADGAQLEYFHLQNTDGAPVVLFPGLAAHPASLEVVAQRLFRDGYNVFVGSWRGSTHGSQLASTRNGLEQVLRFDSSAIVREILQRHLRGRSEKIVLMGHSMGGMMAMGLLSQSQLAAEFAPFIKGVVLFQSPYHVRYVSPLLLGLARVAPYLLRQLRGQGWNVLDFHRYPLQMSHIAKRSGSLVQGLIARWFESLMILLAHFTFDSRYSSATLMRRLVFKMQAEKIPLDLLEDFSIALRRGGNFYDADGERLIQPERVRVPVLMFSSGRDTLAPLDGQREYFAALGAPEKRHVVLGWLNHTQGVLHLDPRTDFSHLIEEFIFDPKRAVRASTTGPVVAGEWHLRGLCNDALLPK